MKKLELSELNVQSFVTNNLIEHKTVNGGTGQMLPVIEETASNIGAAGIVCMTRDVLEISIGTYRIIRTVQQSNANGNCTGWSRLGCDNMTGATGPCDSTC